MKNMKRIQMMRAMAAAAVVTAMVVGLGSGCKDSRKDGKYNPTVDVNGMWDVRLDGDPLGSMRLDVSEGGILKGTLSTTQGADAQLSGYMDEREAEFTVVFPAEAYLAAVTFSEDAATGSGNLIDNKGFRRVLRLTRFPEILP